MPGYHLVLRPPIDALPSIAQAEEVIKGLKNTYSYMIGAEKGSSTGDEKYNHLDIVLELDKDMRVDAVKRMICDKLEIPKDKRRNCKCYAIDEDRILYQIGYSMKEGGEIKTDYCDATLREGKEAFDKIGVMKVEKFTKEKWNIDDVAREYEKWLRHFKPDKPIEENDVHAYFKTWKNKNKENMSFSVFQKVNIEKLAFYIADS